MNGSAFPPGCFYSQWGEKKSTNWRNGDRPFSPGWGRIAGVAVFCFGESFSCLWTWLWGCVILYSLSPVTHFLALLPERVRRWETHSEFSHRLGCSPVENPENLTDGCIVGPQEKVWACMVFMEHQLTKYSNFVAYKIETQLPQSQDFEF